MKKSFCGASSDAQAEIETDLTEEERAIIVRGRQEYRAGGYVSLDSLN